MDEMAADHIDSFVEQFSFMRGRVLFCIEGNHTWNFVTKYPGLTSDQVYAAKFSTTDYRAVWGGALCHARVLFNFGHGRGRTVVIAAHHGKAGGKRIGAAFNQIEDMGHILDADIYAMGHNHRADSLHGYERLHLKDYRGGDTVAEDIGNISRAPLYVRTGSFLKAYPSGSASYVVSRILPPSALGAMEVDIEFRRCQKGGEDKIIHIMNGRVVR
jgi:hypothetical protein